MKSILDKSFKYRDSSHTDIRLTFAKERKAIAKRIEQEQERTFANILRMKRA